MSSQVRASPFVERSIIEVIRQQPVLFPEIPCNVFFEITSRLHAGQFIQVFIMQIGIFGLLLKPGIQQ
jgi:hypothetical protein